MQHERMPTAACAMSSPPFSPSESCCTAHIVDVLLNTRDEFVAIDSRA